MLQSTGAICYANFVIRLILPLELQRHFQMKLSGSSTSTTLALSSPTQPGLMNTKLERLIIKASLLSRTACPSTRSEEHTSELQSLMRISYALFCLKKKTTNNQNQTYAHNNQYTL